MFRGRALECITFIGMAVGNDRFAPDAREVMEATVKIVQVGPSSVPLFVAELNRVVRLADLPPTIRRTRTWSKHGPESARRWALRSRRTSR